jgi:metal-sulfur cluster biosynthetic enzyme
MTRPAITKHRILELLDYVKDPEIPAINVLELGVVRSVEALHLSCG